MPQVECMSNVKITQRPGSRKKSAANDGRPVEIRKIEIKIVFSLGGELLMAMTVSLAILRRLASFGDYSVLMHLPV